MKILCLLGIHREIGITEGAYIRCYGCGKDYLDKLLSFKSYKGWVKHETMLEYRKFHNIKTSKITRAGIGINLINEYGERIYNSSRRNFYSRKSKRIAGIFRIKRQRNENLCLQKYTFFKCGAQRI